MCSPTLEPTSSVSAGDLVLQPLGKSHTYGIMVLKMVGIEDLDAWNDDGSVEELKAFYCILSNAIQIQILCKSPALPFSNRA